MLLLLLAAQHSSLSQTVQDTAPQTGLLPSNTYTVDKLETIDRVNGNVMYHIPLASLPRVGSSDPFQLELVNNSQNLVANYSYVSDPTLGPGQYNLKASLGSGSGWSYNYNYRLFMQTRPTSPAGNASCPDPTSYKLYSLVLITPDGAEHLLKLYGHTDANGDGFYSVDPSRAIDLNCNNGSTPISGPLTYFTDDGTYIRVVVSIPNTSSGTLDWTAYWPDGTVVADTWSDHYTHQTTITDRNANTTTILTTAASDSNPSQNPIRSQTKISNAAGSITIQNQYASDTESKDVITTTGYAGAPLTWTVHYLLQGFTGGLGTYVCDSKGNTCPSTLAANFITSIDLPSPTGVPLSFQFGYSINGGWGNLNSVQYPSGATVTYRYRNDGVGIGVGPNFLTNPVTRKEVNYNDTQDGITTAAPPQVWTFAYQVKGTTCNTMTAPDQGVDTVCFTQLQPTSEALTGSIYKHTTATGQIEEKQFSFNRPAWDDSHAPNPYVSMEVKTQVGSSGSVAAVVTHGFDWNGNETQTNEYEFVSASTITHDATGQVSGSPTGALLRATTRTYEVKAPAASNPTPPGSTTDAPGGYWRSDTSPLLRLLARSVTTGTGTGAAVENDYDNTNTTGNLTQRRQWDSSKSPALPSALTAANAQVENYTYDSRGNLTSRTDARGVQTKYTYDSLSLFLVSETLAYQTGQAAATQAETFSFARDPSTGLMISRTDANNVQTCYGYDLIGRLTSVTTIPGGSTDCTHSSGIALANTRTSYDDANLRIIVQKDLNTAGDGALVTVTKYDPLGRIVLTRQLENTTQNVNDDSSGIKVQTRYQYNGANNYQLVSNPYRAASSTAASAENTMGWTVAKVDQDGRVVSSQSFDGSGLPFPWGSNTNTSGTVTTSYDAQASTATNPAGTVTRLTDQAGAVRQSWSDSLGRLVQVIEDPGTSPHFNYQTVYGYDALDDLACVNQGSIGANNACDPAQPHARQFTYDSLKRLAQVVNPESDTTSYTYDANGNLHSKTDANNITTKYGTYDALNRVTSKSYNDNQTPAVTYSYDVGTNAKGRLTQVSNTSATINYTAYDALGRVTQSNEQIGTNTYSFQYTYNLSGSLTSKKYPSGRTVATCYDGANRVSQVSGSTSGAPDCEQASSTQTNYVTGLSYWPHGAPQSYVYGNNLVRQTAFNSRLQPTLLQDSSNNPGPILWRVWPGWNGPNNANDNNGNLRSLLEENGGPEYPTQFLAFQQSFTYDGVNRLQTAGETNNGSSTWTRNFGYDQYGNSCVVVVSGMNAPTAPSCTQDTAQHLVPLSGTYDSSNHLQVNSASFDAAGNQKSANGNGLAYDAENRQIRFIPPPGMGLVPETYAYDGQGNRVQKSGSGITTTYVYDAFNQLAAEYSSASPTSSPCTPCYLSEDHLGSVRLVTKPDGTVLARHDYLPFGEEIGSSAPGRNSQFGANDSVSQRFTGQERDQESGLDYFGARYYGAALGRWTSPDRINLTRLRLANPTNTLNKYVYAANNPYKFIDRDGEDITIFYRPSSGLAAPSTGNYGHIFLGALNQATGKVGFLDFYPAGSLNRGKGPGAFNQGDMKDRLSQSSQFATLTIQTTPEEAQKVLDLINKLKSGDAPDYAVFSSNCTTVCETVLHDLGLDFGDISPDTFFNDTFLRYGAATPGSYDNLIQSRVSSFMPGQEYGHPRDVGMDFTRFLFQLYFNQVGQQNQKPVKACVSASDDQGNTTGTTCN